MSTNLASIISQHGHFEDSRHIFRSCAKDWIVVFRKLEDSVTDEKRPAMIADSGNATFRADKLEVVKIFNKYTPYITTPLIKTSYYETHQHEFKTGQVVMGCISYYKTLERAYYQELDYKELSDGPKKWDDDGEILCYNN